MKDGKAIKISKEAYEKLERLRKTKLGSIPRGRVASNIILQYNKED